MIINNALRNNKSVIKLVMEITDAVKAKSILSKELQDKQLEIQLINFF